jgi:hypothetical protein
MTNVWNIFLNDNHGESYLSLSIFAAVLPVDFTCFAYILDYFSGKTNTPIFLLNSKQIFSYQF